MVVLGLGSNEGDRLSYLRAAFYALKNSPLLTITQVSPLYLSDALLPDNAPQDWDMPYLNLAIRCETTLTPQNFLAFLKQIEKETGRIAKHWGPRPIDIDILAWDDLELRDEKLCIPHLHLTTRPFALWPLADVAPEWMLPQAKQTAATWVERWGSRFTGDAPFHTKQIYQRIDTPALVGILNATPDSFSDGALFNTVEKAKHRLKEMVDEGAEWIDIGAESTSPEAKPIDEKTEWARLEPILLAIKNTQAECMIPPKICVDTRHAYVAERALLQGINAINDVSGLDNPSMVNLVREAGVECIVMHHLKIPEDRQYFLARDKDVTKLVFEWAEQRLNQLEKQGINLQKIIFDPGIGFGKMAEQSLSLIKEIALFKKLGVRLLAGHSRKTFLSLLTPFPFAERDLETATISTYLATQEIDYLRLHNVGMTARALRVNAALAFQQQCEKNQK